MQEMEAQRAADAAQCRLTRRQRQATAAGGCPVPGWAQAGTSQEDRLRGISRVLDDACRQRPRWSACGRPCTVSQDAAMRTPKS